MDLRGVYRGELSWRQVRAFLTGLPSHGTALARATRGREADDWTQLHEIVASQVDVTAALYALTYDVNRPKGAKAAPRLSFPRPHLPEPGDTTTAAAHGQPTPPPMGTAQDLIAALGGAVAVSVN